MPLRLGPVPRRHFERRLRTYPRSRSDTASIGFLHWRVGSKLVEDALPFMGGASGRWGRHSGTRTCSRGIRTVTGGCSGDCDTANRSHHHRSCYPLGHGRPMLFRFGTSPAAMIRSASGRIASTSSTARSPRVATRGAAESIGAGFDGIASLGARRSGMLVAVEPVPLSKMHDRRSPLWIGPPAVGLKARPFGAPSRSLQHKRLARVDLVGDEARDMAVTSMLTHRTQGLPELEVGCARIGKSGVRRSQRSAREVSCVDGRGGERRGSPNLGPIDRFSQQPTSAASIADRRASMSCRGAA